MRSPESSRHNGRRFNPHSGSESLALSRAWRMSGPMIRSTKSPFMRTPGTPLRSCWRASRTAREPIRLGRGRVLVLKGDSGAGKTHLMGALRQEVERRGAGYFAYAPMTTGLVDLKQYLLRSVVDCLQRPSRWHSVGAWLRLSDALVERPCVPEEERETLRSADEYSDALRDVRRRLLEDLPSAAPRRMLHGDFLRASSPSAPRWQHDRGRHALPQR